MNIGSRIAAWFGEKKLPYDAEVEYIASTDNAFLGYLPTILSTDWIKFRFDSRVGYYAVPTGIFGSGLDASYGITNSWYGQQFVVLNNGTVKGNIGYGDWTTRDFVYELNESGFLATRYGTQSKYAISYAHTTIDNGVLFKCNCTMREPLYSKSGAEPRLYYFQSGDSSSLKIDLIPVRKDGVGYMYDRVSGKLFGNAGTGALIIGPDKPANVGGGGINA